MTVDAAKSCAATFTLSAPTTYLLSVQKTGDGSEDSQVTSVPTGINCGTTCSAAYVWGTNVYLVPAAADGYEFAYWQGEGCATGTVSMTGARTCTAVFQVLPPSCDPDGSLQAACRASGGGRWDEESCSCQFNWEDPLVLSLDGSPIHLTTRQGGVWFDVDGDGVRESLAWTRAGSTAAFLVLDLDQDGAITTGAELFGVPVAAPRRQKPLAGENSFTLLAAYDASAQGGNGDGLISAADAVFSRLRLWIDTNHDGVSQPNELVPLASAGVTAIELSYRVVGRRDGHGNLYRYRGVVHLSSGRRVPIWDVFLSTGPQAGSDSEGSEDMLPLDDNSASVAMSARAGVAPTPVGADDEAGLASEPALPDPTPTPLQVVEDHHLDAIGSVRAVTDAQGQVIARHDFLPFGEELAPQSPPRDRRLFTGQERDFETALDYFHARQLRTDLGRFTTPDPLTDVAWTNPTLGATNAYGYVQSNPLGFIDPMGAQAQEESKPGGHWKCQYVWKNPCVWIPDVPTFRVTISEVYYPGPDLWLSVASSDSAGGGGTTFVPGGGGGEATQAQKDCIKGALASGSLMILADSVGLIPEVGGAKSVARGVGHFFGYTGAVADKIGIKAVTQFKEGADTLSAAYSVGQQDWFHAALDVAGFVPGLGQAAAGVAMIYDGYNTWKAIQACR